MVAGPRKPPAMASNLSVLLWRPPSCILSMCVLRGLSAHPPSPVELLRRGSRLPGGGSYISPLLCVSCVPPLVSIFDLFLVLVKCDYEFILVQLCLSHYIWLSCVFIVLSIKFDFVWSTRYSPVFLSASALPCLALPCLESLKTVIWVISPFSSFLPRVYIVTISKSSNIFLYKSNF